MFIQKNNVQLLLSHKPILHHKGTKVNQADPGTALGTQSSHEVQRQERRQLQHIVMGLVWREHVARDATR